MIFRQDKSFEGIDVVFPGHGRQPLDKFGSDTLFLIRIQDNESNFRSFRFGRQPGITPDGDDVFPVLFNCLSYKGELVNIIYGTKTQGVFHGHIRRRTLEPQIFRT